jgi:triosephosphate isomerase (TIM)
MDARKPFIAGNWKMYKTSGEAEQTAAEIVRLTTDITGVDILIAPPFTALSGVSRIIAGAHVFLGAQNLFWEKEGAFTGEISPAMLADAGCSHVIIGHSERRQYFGETDETVNKKVMAAINFSLIPVLCVGETEKERDAGQTFYVLDKQIKKGLEGFSFDDLARMVVAYEPVWAIGTGKTATRDQAQEAHHFLRGLLQTLFGKTGADALRIVYGGSVKPGNIKELMDMPDVDGALVGGASLDAATFSAIVHYNS